MSVWFIVAIVIVSFQASSHISLVHMDVGSGGWGGVCCVPVAGIRLLVQAAYSCICQEHTICHAEVYAALTRDCRVHLVYIERTLLNVARPTFVGFLVLC